MNYTKDTTRLSVLVVAFLLVGSAFAVLPAFASTGAAVTNAVINNPTQNGSPPAVTAAPNVIQEGSTPTAIPFAVLVSNPASNAYAVVSFSVLAPSGWTFSTTPGCSSVLPTVGATSSSGVQCTTTGSGLPPGFSTTLLLGDITGPTSTATSPPVLGTFTTLVVDASSASSYAGSSFNAWTIAPTTITSSVSATSYTAGSSALTVTSTLSSLQAGVPITWNYTTSYPSSGYTASLSPSSTLTSSSGATSSFTPSNHHPDATAIEAWVGNGLTANDAAESIHATSASIETFAGAPSIVSFYFTSPPVTGSTYATDYLVIPVVISSTLYAEAGTGATNELSMALSDAYANPVPLSTSITAITLSASGGYFYYIGGTLGGTTTSSLTCGAANGDLKVTYCQSGDASGIIQFPIPAADVEGAEEINYVQSSVYGAVGAMSGSITASSATYTGSSGDIVTSTLIPSTDQAALPAPGFVGYSNSTAINVPAGSSLTLAATIEPITGYYQEGVPVTFNLCNVCASTSTGYDAVFSSGSQSITLYTDSSGIVSTSIPVNVTLGSAAVFNATALDPTITDTTNTIASANTLAVNTAVGAISTLVVNVAFGTSTQYYPGPNVNASVPSGTALIDAAYADAYGNLIPLADAPTTQVQIGLSATNGGLLSATNVYISAGDVSTNDTTAAPFDAPVNSFGPIQLTMPSTIGTSVVITATGVVAGKSVSGTATVTVVSASPSITVTAPVPVSGYLYANATEVTFRGYANATAGNASTTITTIGYEVGTSGWQSIATPIEHNVPWAIPVVLVAGLNTVTFNVTDSNSVTTVLPAYTVLVDTSAPVLTTPTLVTSTNSAALNATSAEGDLNASSVQAWANGTALPSSDITVTGTNNPGSSVTYTITVSNLALGTWTLEVQATTLAGDSATASGSVTVTVTTTQVFSFPSASSSCALGTYSQVVCVPVQNTGTGAVTGIVLAVVTNSAGQTVEVSTATVTVSAGGTQTAYVILNLPSGSYSTNVFVLSSSGASLSAPEIGSITLS